MQAPECPAGRHRTQPAVRGLALQASLAAYTQHPFLVNGGRPAAPTRAPHRPAINSQALQMPLDSISMARTACGILDVSLGTAFSSRLEGNSRSIVASRRRAKRCNPAQLVVPIDSRQISGAEFKPLNPRRFATWGMRRLWHRLHNSAWKGRLACSSATATPFNPTPQHRPTARPTRPHTTKIRDVLTLQNA